MPKLRPSKTKAPINLPRRNRYPQKSQQSNASVQKTPGSTQVIVPTQIAVPTQTEVIGTTPVTHIQNANTFSTPTEPPLDTQAQTSAKQTFRQLLKTEPGKRGAYWVGSSGFFGLLPFVLTLSMSIGVSTAHPFIGWREVLIVSAVLAIDILADIVRSIYRGETDLAWYALVALALAIGASIWYASLYVHELTTPATQIAQSHEIIVSSTQEALQGASTTPTVPPLGAAYGWFDFNVIGAAIVYLATLVLGFRVKVRTCEKKD